MSARDILASWYTGKDVLIFGHRGASAYAPMNTIPAFELAYEQGADGIELDVHLTKDGELIIVHDFTVDHTTNSEGLVTEKTLEVLKSLDAGSWFDKKFTGTRLPTLGEVFEAVGDKLYINVEIKTLSRVSDGTEQAVATCIKKHNMSERVIVSSFNPMALKRFRAIAPEIPLGYLIHPATVSDISELVLQPDEYEALHPLYEMIDDDYLAFAKENNLVINTWTVNKTDIALKMKSIGVHCIMSDYPDIIIKALS